MALILVDRVAPCQGLGQRLKGLVEGRLHRTSGRDDWRRRGDSARMRRREARSRRVQLGYWLFFVGLIVARLFVLVQNGG